MRREQSWSATKFVVSKGVLRASADREFVAPSSRMIVDIVASVYADKLQKHATGSLLDLGCGNAPLYGVYGPVVSQVCCVDWPQTPHCDSYIDVACDLNKGIPIKTETFDTVLLTDVLEHISQPDTLFMEIARVLRPAGKVILGVPFMYWLHEEPHDYLRYTEHKLRQLCVHNNLSVLEVEPYGGFREICLDLIAKNLRGGRKATLSKCLVQTILGAKFIKQLSKSTARQFPLGYCLVAHK